MAETGFAAAAGCANLCSMTERDSDELAELADLLRERNAVEAHPGRLLDRPATTGHIGEWIAARIFDIELETAANSAGCDGRFTTGAVAGQTVNVKAYTRYESSLDINPNAPLDYCLVFAGTKVRPRRLAARCGPSASTPSIFSTPTSYTESLNAAAFGLGLRRVSSGLSGMRRKFSPAQLVRCWL
jgi:hypothetical protein